MFCGFSIWQGEILLVERSGHVGKGQGFDPGFWLFDFGGGLCGEFSANKVSHPSREGLGLVDRQVPGFADEVVGEFEGNVHGGKLTRFVQHDCTVARESQFADPMAPLTFPKD